METRIWKHISTLEKKENMKTKITTQTTSFLADMETPVGIYLKIRDIYAESALLESSDYHSNDNSFSFVGVNPIARFKVENHIATKEYPCGSSENEQLSEQNNLATAFQNFINDFEVKGENPTKVNGFFGYTSHDAIQYFESSIDSKNTQLENAQLPEFYYILYRFIIVINHLSNELTIVENILEGENSKSEELIAVLKNNNIASYNFESVGTEESYLADEKHSEMIEKGIKLCQSGELSQIVLSRCFTQKFRGDEFNVYRALRSINPSPYLFYFDFGAFRIFGSSPETHCKISKGKAYIDPIAGTYRRTGDDMKDKELSEELLRDDKEVEEHDMLVDFARNDLDKNCTDVKVDFYKNVQFYSHVIHLVSRVSGIVKPEISNIKVYADTFPAGTLVGSPKLKALQYIKELESTMRGFYGGCIGYIGFNGDLNQAITIRTFLSKKNTLYYQAGGGIVAKSKPENEVMEVKNKLRALKTAVDTANNIKN